MRCTFIFAIERKQKYNNTNIRKIKYLNDFTVICWFVDTANIVAAKRLVPNSETQNTAGAKTIASNNRSPNAVLPETVVTETPLNIPPETINGKLLM